MTAFWAQSLLTSGQVTLGTLLAETTLPRDPPPVRDPGVGAFCVGAGLGGRPYGCSKPQGPQDPKCVLQLFTHPSFLWESKFL